jgi:hypothetical protein
MRRRGGEGRPPEHSPHCLAVFQSPTLMPPHERGVATNDITTPESQGYRRWIPALIPRGTAWAMPHHGLTTPT